MSDAASAKRRFTETPYNRVPRSRVRRWIAHLWREWTVESWRPIAPAFAHPQPNEWSDAHLTAAWIGHATVLINFFGITVLTDPVLFPRIGIRLPFFTIGPKRLTAPALTWRELPPIDLVLLTHAHFDHIDTRTLRKISGRGFQPVSHRLATGRVRPVGGHDAGATKVVTAPNTRDLLRWTSFRDITELRWGDSHELRTDRGSLSIKAFRVNHWGARLQRDQHRGYNGYILQRNHRRVIFAGDTALTDSFAQLRDSRPYDLAIMSIAAYNPWIRSHCTPEQAIEMCNAAGVTYIMPVHHQTFRLSFEPFREPIERFEAALRNEPNRIALREIGETFVLPL